MTAEEREFLKLVHDPEKRESLLRRLDRLGLLQGFLAVEKAAEGSVKA